MSEEVELLSNDFGEDSKNPGMLMVKSIMCKIRIRGPSYHNEIAFILIHKLNKWGPRRCLSL